MAKVFISYRHVQPDENLADECCAFFEREGFMVFVDKRILAGQRWAEELTRQLQTSNHLSCCCRRNPPPPASSNRS